MRGTFLWIVACVSSVAIADESTFRVVVRDFALRPMAFDAESRLLAGPDSHSDNWVQVADVANRVAVWSGHLGGAVASIAIAPGGRELVVSTDRDLWRVDIAKTGWSAFDR